METKILEIIKKETQCSTWRLAAALKVPTPKMLRKMKALQKSGLVELCQRYTSVNNLVWKITDEAKVGDV